MSSGLGAAEMRAEVRQGDSHLDGDSKVSELQLPSAREKQVARLDVAVEAVASVEVDERGRRARERRGNLICPQGPVAKPERVEERPSRTVLGHQPEVSRMDMRGDEGEDVGRVACAEHIHLSAEIAPRLAVGPVERHCLDRHELGRAIGRHAGAIRSRSDGGR